MGDCKVEFASQVVGWCTRGGVALAQSVRRNLQIGPADGCWRLVLQMGPDGLHPPVACWTECPLALGCTSQRAQSAKIGPRLVQDWPSIQM